MGHPGKIKVAWIASYPLHLLESHLAIARPGRKYHPCSWIVSLSEALAKRPDIELHLLTETPVARGDQTLLYRGIYFHVLQGGIPFLHRGFPPFLPLNLLAGFRLEIARYRHRLRSIQPHLVHAHGTESALALAALSTERPCLISIQGIIAEYFKTNPNFRFRIVRHYERDAVRRGHYFTCRTAFDTGFVQSLNPQARIFQIQEAMNPVFFQQGWQPTNEDRLLYVGSLEERKGLPALLAAFREVLAVRPATSLTLIGDGDRATYEQRCRAWGIDRQVRFLGFQPAERIAAEHLAAQIFVLPSDNENSPNALAEAMVTGMPVVATAVGGIPSMVEDGRTGLLVPPRQPGPLRDAILRLLTNRAERTQLAANARVVARQRHDPEQIAGQTVAAYCEVLAAADQKKE